METAELIRRCEQLLNEITVDTDDVKQVVTFEKLTKLWLALKRAERKEEKPQLEVELDI